MTSFLTDIVRWFDTSNRYTADQPEKLTWWSRIMRFVPLGIMHGMCLGVIWVGWSWTALAVAVAMYAVRMFAITGFYHRYFSHRTFKTSRLFQFVMGAWGNSATQRGPLWWAAHHRHHHRHSDEEDDVHSPIQHGLYWAHIGWITDPRNFPTDAKVIPDLYKYPELRWLDRYDTAVPIATGAAMFYLGVALNHWFPQLHTNGMQMLVWGFFVSSVVLFHGTCTINSLAHMMGRKRYRTKDESRNSFLLALLTFGEGWHNNHHYYPGATRQGFYWWEIDITFYCLKLMSWMGLIWDLNRVPESVRETNKIQMPAPVVQPQPA